jgi:hypothetical protein
MKSLAVRSIGRRRGRADAAGASARRDFRLAGSAAPRGLQPWLQVFVHALAAAFAAEAALAIAAEADAASNRLVALIQTTPALSFARPRARG